MKRKKQKAKNRSWYASELDKLWSKRIRDRDGCCVLCGKTSRLSAHHIFSRRYMGTRWDLDNGVTLCGGCHLFIAHQRYEEFRDALIKLIGVERFENVKQRSKEIKKWDLQELEELLQNL